MSIGDPHGYQVGAVATASPSSLVTMLFDAAVAAINRARQALTDRRGVGSVETVNRELTRAQDIVTELQLSLDHGLGGEIAETLDALYGFCLDRLIRANLDKDLLPLAAADSVLSQLRDAWVEAVTMAEAS